jgi:hypothetical protein
MQTKQTVDVAELERLAADATPGPWYVGRFDDEHFMSAISIEAYLSNETGQARSEVIAATLIQQPRYVDPSDARWSENARLITEMRNALPELLRLARIGLTTERHGA